MIFNNDNSIIFAINIRSRYVHIELAMVRLGQKTKKKSIGPLLVRESKQTSIIS